MAREGFDAYLRGRKVEEGKIGEMVSAADDLEGYLESLGRSMDDCDVEVMNGYLSYLIKRGENPPSRLVAVARYCAYCKRPELYIHLATMLNSYDILPLMAWRTGELMGENRKEAIFYGFERPPLGTPPEEYPHLASRIIDRMEGELTPEQCREVLSWNYHEIPKEAFAEKRKRFKEAADIDEFLRGEHESLLKELEECLRTGRVWYEQEVTREFVDHVAGDQRVQVGVREGDRIVHEKVPFDTKRYYRETSPTLKRYYYCHCPLVRSSIKSGHPKVSSTFCNCSAGFTKTAWEAIFDEPLEAEVLRSVLAGDDRCVFSIKIPRWVVEGVRKER